MFGIHDLWLFVLSGLLLNITPGPDTLYIVARSSTQGARAGVLAALGIGTGALVHVCAASLGLSAILAASAIGFSVVKIIGAAYLGYVGISLILSSGSARAAVAERRPPAGMRAIFLQGFLTNVLNPKVALFFLAFVPQFIDHAAPHKALAFIVLGLVFNVNGMLWCNFLAWSAATASARFKGKGAGRLAGILNRATGGLFVALGVKLVLSKQN